MAISVIEQAERLWSEFRNEAERNILFLQAMNDGCFDCDNDSPYVLSAIIEDAYVYGVFLRDKDIVVYAEDINRACGKLKSSISFHFSTVLPLDNLDDYVSPCACVGPLADGLVRIMLDMSNGRYPHYYWSDVIAPRLLDAFESFFVWAFLAGICSKVLPDICFGYDDDDDSLECVPRPAKWADVPRALAKFKQKNSKRAS